MHLEQYLVPSKRYINITYLVVVTVTVTINQFPSAQKFQQGMFSGQQFPF